MCTFADNKALWRVELSWPGCSKNKYELSECRAGGRRRGQVIGTACISGSGRYKYGDQIVQCISSLLNAIEVSRSEAHAEVRQGLGCLEMAKVFCCPLATKQQRLQHTSDYTHHPNTEDAKTSMEIPPENAPSVETRHLSSYGHALRAREMYSSVLVEEVEVAERRAVPGGPHPSLIRQEFPHLPNREPALADLIFEFLQLVFVSSSPAACALQRARHSSFILYFCASGLT